jgi:hypothetical protein
VSESQTHGMYRACDQLVFWRVDIDRGAPLTVLSLACIPSPSPLRLANSANMAAEVLLVRFALLDQRRMVVVVDDDGGHGARPFPPTLRVNRCSLRHSSRFLVGAPVEKNNGHDNMAK